MYGFGAILFQKCDDDGALHPIYYTSGKTTDIESRYTRYELETLAIIKALRRFRIYLLGINFKIVTICEAFALTINKKDMCVRTVEVRAKLHTAFSSRTHARPPHARAESAHTFARLRAAPSPRARKRIPLHRVIGFFFCPFRPPVHITALTRLAYPWILAVFFSKQIQRVLEHHRLSGRTRCNGRVTSRERTVRALHARGDTETSGQAHRTSATRDYGPLSAQEFTSVAGRRRGLGSFVFLAFFGVKLHTLAMQRRRSWLGFLLTALHYSE
ncbi:hypothetical protein PUN28_014667 [Cardiocondyla obscurior]|uniref:Reverse transcriptase RNase H-like domain-containing protein n=1 Tax=Cardiocondyla obscurior TaxID=286306 RepID=A0AAW2F0U9_9HYME